MNVTGNTIFITGGTSGIGMAMATRFLELGNEVIICGRDEKKLQAMKEKHPALHVRVGDTGVARDREDLWNWVSTNFSKVNVLINNAGIQRKVDLKDPGAWKDVNSEIDINLGGPIHLSLLAIPHLLKQSGAIIANVSSGLAFVPLTNVPVYCATKAALHSFTLSLRRQLIGTSIGVVEIIPPAVRTNLGGSHDFGEPLFEFTDAAIEQMKAGKQEVTYTFSAKSSQASRAELDEIFKRMNAG